MSTIYDGIRYIRTRCLAMGETVAVSEVVGAIDVMLVKFPEKPGPLPYQLPCPACGNPHNNKGHACTDRHDKWVVQVTCSFCSWDYEIAMLRPPDPKTSCCS